MTNLYKSIKENIWVFRSLAKTVYFNFHYLPFKQAIKLPVWLYKPKLKKTGGSIKIHSGKISTGMIRLGYDRVSVYPNSGISLEINGNVVFNGSCCIGNDSFIAVDKGELSFGDFFNATAATKIICRHSIHFGNEVLIGWNNMVCDSDFHHIHDAESGESINADAPIKVGNHVWIANGCSIMKGSDIPDDVVVAAKSLVNKKLDIPSFSIVAGIPAKLKKTGVKWSI